jgi:hypothetical protein
MVAKIKMLSIEFEMLLMGENKTPDELKVIEDFWENGEIKDINEAIILSIGDDGIRKKPPFFD